MKIYSWEPENGDEEVVGCYAAGNTGNLLATVYRDDFRLPRWEVSMCGNGSKLVDSCGEGKAIADEWLARKGYEKIEASRRWEVAASDRG